MPSPPMNSQPADAPPEAAHPPLSRPAWLIPALIAVGLAGLAAGAFSVWLRYFIFTDGAVYAALGQSLAEGRGLRYCGGTHLFYPPGYPVAIALLYLFCRDAEFAAHGVSLLAYLSTIMLTASLAWRLRRSPMFILAATAGVTLHPYNLLYASYALSEALFAAAVLASALCAWRLATEKHPPLRLWAAWGVLGGYAYLIRADGILYFPLQAVFVGWLRQRDGRARYWKFGFSGILFFAVMFPYLLLIKQETGAWQLSTKTPILLEFARGKMLDSSARGETAHTSQLSEDGKTFQIDRAEESLGAFIFRHPREAWERVAWNLRNLIRSPRLEFGWIDIPLLLILAVSLGRGIFSRAAGFVILHLIPVGLFLFFYLDSRFFLAFTPFFVLGAARVVEILLAWAARISPARLLAFGLPLVLVTGLGGTAVYGGKIKQTAQRLFAADLPLEHKALGLWMKSHLPITPVTRITHRNPWVSFYAGGCHQRIFAPDPERPEGERLRQLVDWCRERGVEYAVVDERMTLPTLPGLAFLLDTSREHTGLKRIHAIAGPEPKIVLYRVEP